MRISIHETVTVREHLACIRDTFGDRSELEDRVRSDPQDIRARVALHDLAEYEGEPGDKQLRTSREVIIPDDRIDELTVTRLQLLLGLKQIGGRAGSLRQLAESLDRDIKNVSQDVGALADLGLLEVERRGRGRAHAVSLPGERIDLHLVDSPPLPS